MVIAAANGHKIYKTDTKQAFLCGNMGQDIVSRYLPPPDWWPEPISEGHVLPLVKSIYGTKEAARKWHNYISGWIIKGTLQSTVKRPFSRRPRDLIISFMAFVDAMMHISSWDELKEEFMDKYSKDFEIRGGGLMKTSLGMKMEQSGKTIKLHLDCHIQQGLAEYKDYIKKMLRPKKVQISPGVILKQEDVPESPEKHYRSFVAKLRLAAT
jgi:hypothetical protein